MRGKWNIACSSRSLGLAKGWAEFMNRFVPRWTTGIVFWVAAAAQGDVTLQPQENWSGVFADADVTFRYAVSVDESQRVRWVWRLSIGDRTVSRGEGSGNAEPGRPTNVDVSFHVPPVKEGVTVEAKLEVGIAGREATASPWRK